MIYLDYSATTKVDDEVLKTFNDISLNYYGNPNSMHKFGISSKKVIDDSTKMVSEIFGIKEDEIIYTSGASESNNLAIKGICKRNKGKHIITTKLEHSSVIATLSYLSLAGYEIEFVNLCEDGTVDINHLKSIIRDDTILVSICAVDSELGIRQPIEEIGLLLKNYNNCYFHTDMTQCIGKSEIDFTNVDLASLSGHKIFCFKGIGILYKKENIIIEPLIHGGKSTSIYRSGTPQTELIVSLGKAIELVMKNIKLNYSYVCGINKLLREKLVEYKDVIVNSTDKSIPHILNISVLGVNPEDILHSLEDYGIYISIKSACSSTKEASTSVFEVTKDENRAKSSIRISLSHKTTNEEINEFLRCFDLCYKNLKGNI